jgi:hypothetical protein
MEFLKLSEIDFAEIATWQSSVANGDARTT